MTQTKWARGEFVAWDGEGIEVRKRHTYAVLASSHQPELVHPKGIPTVDALAYLCDGFALMPHAIHVGFAVSYDANMMLADLPRPKLAKLWASERVTYKGYRIEWRPRKFLRVHDERTGDGGTLWDTWPFFQSSFVGALERYGVAPDVRADIQRMKLRRERFTARELPRIIAYNRSELTALVALCEALMASLKSAGLTIARWDGPGAIAAALLAKHGFKKTIAVNGAGKDALLDAMQYAYYGGRIEAVRYGHHVGTVHHYDVNSAYPAAMRTLPCRAKGCGKWRRLGEHTTHFIDAGRFAVHHVRWTFAPRVVYPFPWRSSRGGVFFPPKGEGWVWSPELDSARAGWQRGDTLHVLESWVWESSCKHKGLPLAWIDDVYAERLAAKARGDGAEHALKLGLNSLYGKLAQRVGAVWDHGTQEWRLPPYHDLAGAGWITSTVRAQLYRAAMQHPAHVIMMATDAIYSTRRLDLPVSPDKDKRLGEWSYTKHTGCTVVQSGVYWTDDADGTSHLYSRGFDADSVERRAVLAGWRAGRAKIHARQRRFIGLGRALAGAESFALWRTWQSDPRDIALHPWLTKRTPMLTRGNRPADPSRGLVRTTAFDTTRYWHDPLSGHGMMTTPSPVPWRDMDDAYADDMDRESRAGDESEDATL